MPRRELEVLEAAGDLAEGVRRDLAVLGGQVRRELMAALVDEVPDLEQDVGPLAERRGAPAGKGGLGRGDGRADLVGRGEVDVPGQGPGGRVVDVALAAGGALDEPAADPVLDAVGGGRAGRLGFGELGHGVRSSGTAVPSRYALPRSLPRGGPSLRTAGAIRDPASSARRHDPVPSGAAATARPPPGRGARPGR